jgi:hypothetical protein
MILRLLKNSSARRELEVKIPLFGTLGTGRMIQTVIKQKQS